MKWCICFSHQILYPTMFRDIFYSWILDTFATNFQRIRVSKSNIFMVLPVNSCSCTSQIPFFFLYCFSLNCWPVCYAYVLQLKSITVFYLLDSSISLIKVRQFSVAFRNIDPVFLQLIQLICSLWRQLIRHF